jgi:ribosomal protein L30/L7E
MTKIEELEEQLVELKLKKRNLILAGKNTEQVDDMIKVVEDEIKQAKASV